MASPEDPIRLVARDEANTAIRNHLTLCPLANAQIDQRLRKVETTIGTLLGLMAGSGVFGGATVHALSKLFP